MKKILGWSIIVMEVLFVLYIICILYGWEQVIKVIATASTMIGILGLCTLFVIALSLISGESNDPSDYFDP